jgi:hypothetical protein
MDGIAPYEAPAQLTHCRLLPSLTHLQQLEAESIHILREAVAQSDNPVMLYSIGKDSSVLLRLAVKAFYPSKLPFPMLHIDTTWKFKDMIAFRDKLAHELGLDLIVHINESGLARGVGPISHGSEVNTSLTSRWPGRDAMRSARVPRSACFPFATRITAGIQSGSARSRGGSTMAVSEKEKAYGSFRSRIGPSLTFGSTSIRSGSQSSRSISLRPVLWFTVTAC